jgi:glycosyltransferase involved in cell wall biosynthesis
VEIARSFDDERVTVTVAPRHAGAVENWNRVLSAAQGEFVKTMGQDDLLYPDCLAVQVDALSADPEAALTASPRDILDGADRVLVRARGLEGLVGAVEPADVVRKVVRSGTNPLGEPVAVLFRRTAAQQAGAFRADLPYMIDLDYWLRLLQAGRLVGVDRTLSGFRVSSGAWSVRLARQQARQAKALFAELHQANPVEVRRSDYVMGCAQATRLGILRRLAYLARRSARDARGG